jgi:hypothetical protein
MDLIYNDLQAEITKIDGEIVAQKALLQEKQDEMAKAEPQTGQFTYHNKKYWGIKAVVDRLNQRRLQLDIQLQLRQRSARGEYGEAWISKKPWPNQDAYAEYLKMKRPFGARKDWDIKSRIADYNEKSKRAPAKAGEAPKSH